MSVAAPDDPRILIGRNVAYALGQHVVVAVSLFVAYRHVVAQIGVEQLGIWGLVVAITSVARVAEVGLAGSVVKHVGEQRALGEDGRASLLVGAGLLASGILLAVALIAALPLLGWVLKALLPPESVEDATRLLPLAGLVLWLTTASGSLQAGLTGWHRVDERGRVVIGASLVYVALVHVLVPRWGLEGLAWAHVGQAVTVAVGSLWRFRRVTRGLPLFAWDLRGGTLRELLTYGASFQAISVASLLLEPITRSLLTRFGGLAAVGYYEMASRLVLQVRGVVIAANQVLVPVIAGIHARGAELRRFYGQNLELVLFVSLPAFGAVTAGAPLIAHLWLGEATPDLVRDTGLLAGGWLINTLSAPAYFAAMGTGRLGWSLTSHWIMATLNLLLGLALGTAWGGPGVVLATATAIAVGGLLQIHGFHSIAGVRLAEVLDRKDATLAAGVALGLAASATVFSMGSDGSLGRATAAFAAFILVALPAALRHPGWATLRSRLPRSASPAPP